MATPHKCPVCDGWGTRKIYEQKSTSCAMKEVTCNACHGTGVIWEYEPVYIPSIWEPQKIEFDKTPYTYPDSFYTITWCDSSYKVSDTINYDVPISKDSSLHPYTYNETSKV